MKFKEKMFANIKCISKKIIIVIVCITSLSACANAKVTNPPQSYDLESIDTLDKNWVKHQHDLGLDTCNGMPSTVHLRAADLIPVPELKAHVNDSAGLLNQNELASLDRFLYDFERQSGSQLAVFIVPSLMGQGIFSYSQKIACRYRLGRKDIGDGVFLVIAMKERRFYLYVMNSVTPFLSDEQAKQILDQLLTPALKRAQYYEGIRNTMHGVMLRIDGKFPLVK